MVRPPGEDTHTSEIRKSSMIREKGGCHKQREQHVQKLGGRRNDLKKAYCDESSNFKECGKEMSLEKLSGGRS